MQCSVVTYSKLQQHPEFRIDAECYTPYHLKIEQSILVKDYKLIDEHAVSVINFGAYSLCNHIEFLDTGKAFLVTEDIKNNVINTESLHYISDAVHSLLHKSHCKKGQVVLTMAGAYLGQAAVFNEDFECSSNQAIAKITIKPRSINPYYLSTFLNCIHGQSQIYRFRTGTGQPNLNLGLIKLIKVVDASETFQNLIDAVVNNAISLRKESVSIYSRANEVVLSELGLLDWNPKKPISYIRKFSDTGQAGRIDAEYFHPKYDEIIDAIKACSSGWELLDSLVSIKKSVEVGSGQYIDEGIPFVRVSDLSPFEIGEEKYISEELYVELIKHQPKKGEILFSKDGSPGIAHYLHDDPKKMIPSGALLRLKKTSDKVNDEYLTLVLNSLLTKEQVNRDVGGSVILHWRPEQVRATVIPVLPRELQSELQKQVVKSRNLRKQSNRLLEYAKQAVEMAIDIDEQTSMDWLLKETGME